mmetsp:Transcript_146751/g.471013  ORF Transcript_146751/g.471013 Transcript_146751/m.471013 type:complete len:195 (+) Transcript_146751:184-768(+)
MAERQTGTVKFFNTQKGYGFIVGPAPPEEPDLQPEYFVHFSAISGDGFKSLDSGEAVEFDLELNEGTGKMCAVRVTGPAGAPVKGAPQTQGAKGGCGKGGKGGKGMDMQGGGGKGKKGKGKGKGKNFGDFGGQMPYGADPFAAAYGGMGGCFPGFPMPGYGGYPMPFPGAYPGMNFGAGMDFGAGGCGMPPYSS